MASDAKMLIVHDLVEIDAGDTFAYDAEMANQHKREAVAAERIFGSLPADQPVYEASLHAGIVVFHAAKIRSQPFPATLLHPSIRGSGCKAG